MKATTPLPDQKVLRDILDYDAKTGLLTWKQRSDCSKQWNGKWAGRPAFTYRRVDGYLKGSIRKVVFLAHRVIWKWQTGDEPPQIDHLNGDPSDNRLINLVPSSDLENHKNHKIRHDNSSGVCGVRWNKKTKKWRAVIGVGGRGHHIGYFSSLEDAAQARILKQREFGYSPRHGK